MFIYLSSFSLIYLFINLFCICLHLSKKYVSGNPKALFTNKVYCSFLEEYKQSCNQAVLRLFTFLSETAVHFICDKDAPKQYCVYFHSF